MNRNQRGFTIVELLVAMSLFTILMAIISGVFVQSLRTQRGTVALIAANSNASLAIEQMSREMRTGKDFDVGFGVGAAGEGESVTFYSSREKQNVTYIWNKTAKSIEKNSERITAENVAVEKLIFNLLENPAGADLPDRITIALSIGAPAVQLDTPFINIQTSVSARLY